jgi:hypothetical protein
VDVPFEADGPAQYTGHKQPYQEVAADGFRKKSKILKHIPKRIVDFPRKKKTLRCRYAHRGGVNFC